MATRSLPTTYEEGIKTLLKVENITKTYEQAKKSIRVLQGISTTLTQGESYAITGASGSGKSTLLHILGGLDTPTSGSVFFNEKNIFSLKAHEKDTLRNQSFGFVFQFHYLIRELTVLENIMMPGLIKGETPRDCKEKAEKLLHFVDLETKAQSFPSLLSGGEQQRVAILRAIFNKPSFLFADEPTGNLDAHNAQQIVELFIRCQKEWDMGLVLCSHDPAVYTRMNNVWHLENGKLKENV